MNEIIKQSAIDKLTSIANQEDGIQLSQEEVDFLGINYINDETILKEKGNDE